MKTGCAKKAGSILLAAMLGVSGAMGTGCLAFAEEATEAANEQTEPETERNADAADVEIEITELEITLGEETLIVSNATGIVVESISAGETASEDTDGADTTEDVDAETAEDADSEAVDGESSAEDDAAALVFTTGDGTVHTFEIADVAELTALTGLTLTEKIGFFFLYGTDGNGDAKYYYETADEITLEESVTMYTTGQVTVRESADGSSEALGYADRGSELKVLGGTSTWFLISQGDLTGYVAARYLTVDVDEAQAAVEAEETAQAAAQAAAQQAAAAAAAQAAAAAAAAASSSDSSSGSQTETTQTDNACLTGGVLN